MASQNENNKTSVKGIGLTTLGWELAVPIFGGILIGYQLDRLLQTSYIFTIGLLLAGIATGYYSLYKRIELEMLRTKAAKQLRQQDQQKEDQST
jgi:F0F1-type ATP synthase assembly protein I